MPISGINLTYNNTGVIGPQDGDIQIKLKEGHRPTEEYVGRCASNCRGSFRVQLRVPARRHRQPDPQFRRAGTDRSADPRRQLAANFAYANKLLSQIRAFPASPMRGSSNRRTIRPSISMSTAPARNMSA